MNVQMYMTRHPKIVYTNTPVVEAARLMAVHNIRRLPVIEEVGSVDRVVGIVTKHDVLHAFPRDLNPLQPNIWQQAGGRVGGTVGDIMTGPVLVVPLDMPIEEAAYQMRVRKMGAIPVVKGEHLVGIITESDVMDALTSVLRRESGIRVCFDAENPKELLAS